MDRSSRRIRSFSWGLLAAGAFAALALAATPGEATNTTIFGDWVIGPTITFANNSENITVFGDVIVQGTLSLTNCTLNITFIPVPPPPQVARLGNLVVTGRVFLINSTVTFDVGISASLPVPNGFRVSSGGSVYIRDADNDPSTLYDASHVEVTRAGSHSTFASGTNLSITNSYFNDAGWEAFPGLQLTGATVFVNGSHFTNRPSGVSAGPTSVTLVRARSGTTGSIGNSTFNGTGIAPNAPSTAFDIAGCPQFRLVQDSVTGFRHGVDWSQAAGVQMENLTFVGHGLGVSLSNMTNASIRGITSAGAGPFIEGSPGEWPPIGSLLVVTDSAGTRVANVVGDASLAPSNAQPARFMALLNTNDTRIDGVVSNIDAALGVAYDSRNLSVANLTATSISGGLSVFRGDSVALDRIDVAGGGARLSFFSSSAVRITDLSLITSGSIGVLVNRSLNIAIDQAVVSAGSVFIAEGSSQLTISNIAGNATETGLGLYDVSAVTLNIVSVGGNITGLDLGNVTDFSASALAVAYGWKGIQATQVNSASISGGSFSPWANQEAGELVWFRRSQDLALSNIIFQGNCTSVGRIQITTTVRIAGFNASGCQTGLSFEQVDDIVFSGGRLSDIWNGTALTFDTVSGLELTDLGIGTVADLGLSVSVVQGFSLRDFEVSRTDAAGAVIAATRDVRIANGSFWNCGGTGLVLLADSGVIQLVNLSMTRNRAGIQLLSTPNATITNVEASSNVDDGISIDTSSPGATLRNLTLLANGKDGLLVGSQVANFIDGYIAANGWSGFAAGPGLRLTWRIEVSGVFADGTARLPGDLIVSAGASFRAERATLRPDSTPISPRTLPWNLWDFGVGSRVTLDNLTVDPVNSSAAYALSFGGSCTANITNSHFNGAGRTDTRSFISFTFCAASIRGSTITGFYWPLSVGGGSLGLTDVLVVDNNREVTLNGVQLTVSNATVRDSDGAGLVVQSGGTVSGRGLNLLNNAWVGLRVVGLDSFSLAGLVATGNAQGGASFDNTLLTGDGFFMSGNAMFSARVSNTTMVALANYTATLNAGAGLRVSSSGDFSLTRCRMDRSGGPGLELSDVGSTHVTDCVVVGSGGYGLSADNAGHITGRNLSFDGSSVSHIWLAGQTDANLRYIALSNSPGDAVVIRDTSTLFLEDLSSDASLTRAVAFDTAYGYLLNATFTANASAQVNSELDIAWKVRVHVVLEDGTPAGTSMVDVWGSTGALLANATTDASGWTPVMEVLEKTHYGARAREDHKPHVFNATLLSGATGGKGENISANAEVTIRIDNAAPTSTIALDGPAGDNGWFTGPVVVSLTTTDGAFGSPTVWWRSTTDATGWHSAAGLNGTAATSFVVGAEGLTIIEFYGQDEAGNQEEVRTVSLRVDTKVPVVELAPLPEVTTEQSFNVTWTVVDSGGSGNLTFLLQVQTYGNPWTDLLSGSNATAYRFQGEEGSYQFRLVATDEAGHESGPSSASVRISLHGSLIVRAVDRSGGDVSGVTVSVEPTGETYMITGALNLSLPPGAYRITVSAPGYTSASVEVDVNAGAVTDPGPLTLQRFEVAPITTDASGLALLLLLLAIGAGAAWVVVRKRMGPPKLGSL